MISSTFYPSVIRPYNEWSDTKLLTEAMKIQTALTDNPNFTSTIPTVPEFSSAIGNYGNQLSIAGSRDVNAVALKNTKRNELIDMCIQLGNSVQTISNGDIDVLISSAMPLRKKAASIVIGMPTNFRIALGINPGELELKVNNMKGVSTYNYEYTPDPPTANSVWKSNAGTTSRSLVTGLESGKRYWFRIIVLGSKGQKVLGETLLSPYVQ